MIAAILRFLVTVAALPFCAQYCTSIHMASWSNCLLIGLILAIVYTVTRPVIRRLLMVIGYPTLMLLYIVTDAWLYWTAASLIPDSVSFVSLWWAVVPALAVNLLRFLIDALSGSLHY